MNRKRLDGHLGRTCLLQCYLSSAVNGFHVVSEQCDLHPRHRLPYPRCWFSLQLNGKKASNLLCSKKFGTVKEPFTIDILRFPHSCSHTCRICFKTSALSDLKFGAQILFLFSRKTSTSGPRTLQGPSHGEGGSGRSCNSYFFA